MKKQILLLAGAAIILASCGGENKTEDAGQSQAQIDSAVNAQVAEREAEMARKNDSTLKAMEAEKAAAEAAAAEEAAKKGGKKTKTPKASPAPTPAPPPPPPPPPAKGGFKAHSDQAQDGTGTQAKPSKGGFKAHSDQSQGN
jgi:sRNA-binding protein